MKNRPGITLCLIFSVLLSGCQTSSKTVDIEPPFITATPEVIAIPTATVEPNPTATERVLTLDEQVDAFEKGKIEFPSKLTPEQYTAFIKEMNAKYTSSAFWVEAVDKNKQPTVLYHDVAKNQMASLPGTYEQNKAVIEQNHSSTIVEIREEKGTGNLQFVGPNTGDLVTVPESSGFNWKGIVTSENLNSGSIQIPKETNIDLSAPIFGGKSMTELIVTGVDSTSVERKANLVPAILIDNKVTVLAFDQGQYFDYNCVEMLFVRTDANGKPIYAVKAFVGVKTGTYAAEEGGKTMETILNSNSISKNPLFEDGGIYFVAISPKQDLVWRDENFATVDNFKNTVPAASRLSDESVFCEDKRPFEAKLACDFGKKDVKERFGA